MPWRKLVAGALLALTALAAGLPGAGAATSGRTVYVPIALRPFAPPDDKPNYVRFAVIGDYGSGDEGEASVAALVKGWDPGFIVTVGDNNYGPDKVKNMDARVDQFYSDYIYPYRGGYGSHATSNRFYPAMGNHDWNSDGLEAFRDYFTLPGNERYYDVVRGPVHFFILDSDEREPDGVTSDSAQGRWLQAELARSASCWKLVLTHYAPYSSGDHGSIDWIQWPFQSWGADAVLAGHDHHYERVLREGFPYFVNGLGGSSHYPVRTPIAGSVVQYNDEFGAMLVQATRTTLSYQFVAIDGTLVDTFVQRGGCG